jgi:hypothetical protein
VYRVHLAWVGFDLTTLVVIGTDCICSCKSNYHKITTTTARQYFCGFYNSQHPVFDKIKHCNPLFTFDHPIIFKMKKKKLYQYIKWVIIGLKHQNEQFFSYPKPSYMFQVMMQYHSIFYMNWSRFCFCSDYWSGYLIS